jgi:hypothetical protein
LQKAGWLAIPIAALTLLSCALFLSRTVTPSLQDSGVAAPVAFAHDSTDGSVDLHGNEVIDAVATYSLDPTGTLYELHSPQTELPRLGSPKS